MTFPPIWPSGVAVSQVIEASELEDLDVDHSKAINGVDGDTVAGAVEFTNATLTTTSSVDTGGDVTCANLYVTVDADVTGNLVVHGNELTVNQSLVVGGDGYIPYLSTDRLMPIGSGTQTIDTSTGAVLALNFTTKRDWVITLNNGADATAPAVLATVATLVDTHADSWRQVPPGMKIEVTFKAGGAQVGGIGISPSATVFPASFHGLTKADLVGPRTGAITATGGDNDWMKLELENIGTTGTPRYACKMTMGSG